VSADAVFVDDAADFEGHVLAVFVDVEVGPAVFGVDPFEVGEFSCAGGADEDWVDEVGPVAGVAVAGVGGLEDQRGGAGDVHIDVDVAPGEHLGREERFGGGLGARGRDVGFPVVGGAVF
jgi:hypothetical protein